MEAGTKPGTPASSEQTAGEDPRFKHAREVSGGDRGREMLEHAAMGGQLDEQEERSALDWLLGANPSIEHDVPVDYETPAGTSKLVFVLAQLDARKIDEIEQRHVNRQTGVVDQFGASVALVAEATRVIRDPSGGEVDPRSEKFRTVRQQTPEGPKDVLIASTEMALERRFSKQLGLLDGVAREIRQIAGFDPARVGKAQRRLVEASLG